MSAWSGTRSLSGGLQVSGNIPDAAATIQHGIIRRGSARAAVCPIWEGVRMIRDEITSAASGQVHVTALALFSFGFVRTAEFGIRSFKVA